ncbi:hypothetical protein EDD85DRAFT_1027001 [Armillaria nabsnona]|nr:hypothetical protein EDD85DRAFT_1027001 [Armillaria nabsnona]
MLTLPDVFNFPNLRHLTITLPASFNFHLFSTRTLEACCISFDDYSPASPGEPNKGKVGSITEIKQVTLDWKLEQALSRRRKRGRVTRFEALVGVLGQSGIDYFTTETAGEQDRWVNKVIGAPPGVSLDARRDFWTTDSARYMYQQMERCARVAEDVWRVGAETGSSAEEGVDLAGLIDIDGSGLRTSDARSSSHEGCGTRVFWRRTSKRDFQQHDLITGLALQPAADDFFNSSFVHVAYAMHSSEGARKLAIMSSSIGWQQTCINRRDYWERGHYARISREGWRRNSRGGARYMRGIPPRLLHSASMARQHPSRGTVYACCAIDKGDGSSIRQAGTWVVFETGSLG